MNLHELHFLVMEDDDFQRRLTVDMLRSLGINSVSEAANGKEALDMVRRAEAGPIDVVLCDLQMPEMDGMEFIRHLGQEGHKASIIITSALDGKLLSSVARMTRMYGIKLLGTIEKPVILEKLRNLLRQQQADPKDEARPLAETPSFCLDQIRTAIHAGQFEPFFQPKVDLKTVRLVGAEALARWILPGHGIVGPGAFIPQLEKYGGIDDLTFLMLEKSAQACRSLLAKGHPLTISVNLSLTSLSRPGLAERITQVVRDAGIDPEYLVLEVTESAAMTHVALALENLARLCMHGFALSIDDYGTGYSSMQQLTRIAFSELKIDQSFVKDFTENPAMGIVVESSVDLARKLGMKSVAEGVETQREWDALRHIGTDTAQGYFIAKPMNLEAFHHFVETYGSQSRGASAPTASVQGDKSILVVDDDNFTRRLVVSVLRNLGFGKIMDTDSAESAIQLFETNKFDLIITDINMPGPGMNGLEFIRRVRAGRTLAARDTRMVVLTAFSQTEILGSALALDVNGFLVKPITPAMVDEKLGKAMTEKFRIRPPIAYEAVITEFGRSPGPGAPPPNPRRGPSFLLPASEGHDTKRSLGQSRISLQKLCPGMTLLEDIRLSDGTLLLSAGLVLSEQSINRLYDLRSLLKDTSVCVEDGQGVT